MFPSCGFFSSFPCHFYVSGLCERPYCHFRHSKHDVEKSRENASSSLGEDVDSSSSSPRLQSSSDTDPRTSASSKPHLDSSSLKEVQLTSGASEKALVQPHTSNHENSAGSFSIPSFTDNSSKYQVPIAEEPEQYVTSLEKNADQILGPLAHSKTDTGGSALPTYLPTPKTPFLPAPQPITDDLGIPVYQPTPKRELKRLHEDQVQIKKAKSSDLEYDPECNYSCGGLIGLSQEKFKIKSDALDYRPTEKKARLSEALINQNRLSCDSLIVSGPNAEDEDDEMPDAEFSDEEEDSKVKATPVKEEIEEAVNAEDDKSKSFENIGDDDISSDDDFIAVPSVSVSKSDVKHQRQPVDKKSAVANKKELNTAVSGKANNAGIKENKKQTSKHITSKSSNQEKLSKTSSHEKLEKSVKLSSSHKKSGLDSKKSSSGSVKGHSSEKIVFHEKESHTSKQSSQLKKEHRAKDGQIKIKKDAAQTKSSDTDRQLSSKSLSKTPSSDKVHISSKHSSSPKKTVSSDSKISASSSKSVLSSSSSRRPNADSKNKDLSKRRSSSENSSSKNVIYKSSDQQKHSKTDNKNLTSVRVKHSDSKTDIKNNSGKHSHSENKIITDKLLKSSSNMSRLPSNERRSSSDSRSSISDSKTAGGQHLHSSCSGSGKKSFSGTSRDQSKDRATHSDKIHDCNKGKERRSSHSIDSESTQKSSSSSIKVTNSSSQHTREKSTHSKSDSNRKDSSKILERMNSSLFGEDSDNEVAESAMSSDDDTPANVTSNSPDSKTAEEVLVDYSTFINESDFEDEDTFDECFRIFKETPVPKKTIVQQEKKLTKDQKKEKSNTLSSAPGKKRTAYKGAEQMRKPELLKKERVRHVLNPGEVMHNRIMEMQRRALERATKQAVQEQEVSSTSGSAPSVKPQNSSLGGQKKRIAHVPKPVTPSASTSTKTSSKDQNKKTVAVTASKTEKRIAHTPNLSNLKRPVIPASFGSKVPSNVRQRYLNLIIDECLKFCPSEETAYKKGLEEESVVYERSSNKNIYLRVAVNTITRLRSEARELLPGSSTPKQRQQSGPLQSHEATLGGARAAKTNFTLHRTTGAGKKTEVALTEPELYQKLLKYMMTEEQLDENGYPRACSTPGKAVIKGKSYQDTDTLLKDNERTCARCGKRFIVNSDGSYTNDEECVYHWTRAYPRKRSGFIQLIYNCCNSDTSSKGCQVAGNHVHERNKRDNLSGFMRTMPRTPPRDGNYGIYALDCEMVYTLGGLELARVTVINMDGDSVFESLVQPFNPIVDYNTRFSGLTAADLADVETTLTDVQAILLSRFSDKTILIGHSLESDLFALKLIHSTVVDTSVVFPHRLGPPYKRALKNLMLEMFQKIIQCDEGGHDSKEDAVACLQLMKWRIKEDSKRENRYSRD